ncbi:Uncharacterized protein HZ326_5908 [Fusarium oxysporum f. sp. albedinis]|nr:Uncharacterized protein HZ326_5908 [Fusarium oxysporum f. sp. albedinis]
MFLIHPKLGSDFAETFNPKRDNVNWFQGRACGVWDHATRHPRSSALAPSSPTAWGLKILIPRLADNGTEDLAINMGRL